MSTITGTSVKGNGVAGFIRRNPLLSMYVLMFTVAWSVMIPQALYSQGLISAPLPEFIEILTGWVPGLAAILVSAVIAGRAGVRGLLGRFLIWRLNPLWYLTGAFLMAFLVLGGIWLYSVFRGEMPAIPAAGMPIWQVALVFIVYVVLGFLINTEEIAWRGFALPHLQKRYGALIAALLITVPEVLFHLPVFWVKENPFFQNVGLLWFSAFSFAAVFIYTFVFNMTRGSLLIVTLLHASQNAWASLLSDNSAGPFYYTVGLTWLVALVLIAITRGTLGYRLDRPAPEKEALL